MIGKLIGILAFLFAAVFVTAFLRGAHSRDDDNAIGEEAAHLPTVMRAHHAD